MPQIAQWHFSDVVDKVKTAVPRFLRIPPFIDDTTWNMSFVVYRDYRPLQPVATCRQSPYLHKPAIIIVTSFWLWRHSLLSWPRPALRTYGRTDTLPV